MGFVHGFGGSGARKFNLGSSPSSGGRQQQLHLLSSYFISRESPDSTGNACIVCNKRPGLVSTALGVKPFLLSKDGKSRSWRL